MSPQPLLSPDWYRVAGQRLRLREGISVSYQAARGIDWWVLGDPLGGEFHRFNRLAYRFLSELDGTRTLDETWALRFEQDGDHAISQAETIELLAKAWAANLLAGELSLDAAAVIRAHQRKQQRRLKAALNPLAIRLPLWNPDRFIARWLPYLAWALRPGALRVAFVLIGLGVVLAALQTQALLAAAALELDSPRSLLLMWLLYPPLKAAHELAHALAIKSRGGQVNEAGLSLLMFTPVPYVNASASTGFAARSDRALVAGAGILVELVVASLALIAWSALEPGLLRDLALALVIMAAGSSLLVNGNPLLRFDGYYVFCDAMDLPNLAPRSQMWWKGWIKSRLFAIPASELQGVGRAEPRWLAIYAPASWLYRGLILAALVVWAAHWSVPVGLGLLAYGLWVQLIGPALKALHWVWSAPELSARRGRAVGLAAAALAVSAMVLFAAPLPHRTWSQGVVWLPEDALVRLASDGFLLDYLVKDGQTISAGTPVARLENVELERELARVESEIEGLSIERRALFETDAQRAEALAARIAALEERRLDLDSQRAHLTVRATRAGQVFLDPRRNLLGQYIERGQILAYVVAPGGTIVRTLVRNEDIALVRAGQPQVSVSLVYGGQRLPAQLSPVTPAATTQLPSAALGDAGGGSLAVDPADKSGRTARAARFPLDVQLPPQTRAYIGARALVEIDHGSASAAEQLGLFIRGALLRHFGQ